MKTLWLVSFVVTCLATALLVWQASNETEGPILEKNAKPQLDFDTSHRPPSKPRILPKKNTTPLSQQDQTQITKWPGFQGANIRGGIDLSESGDLLVNNRFRMLLEYVSTMRGRFPTETIRSQFLALASQKLTGDKLALALDIFDNYQSYLDQMPHLRETQMALGDLKDTLQNRRDLRRQFLGEEVADKFFKRQEQYEDFQLALRDINQDISLSEQEKYDLRMNLEDTLPQDMRIMRRETQRFSRLKTQLGKLLPQQQEQAVELQYGQEAASRYSKLLQQRSLWRQKMDDYKQYRQTLMNDGYPEDVMDMMLKDYKMDHFSSLEQRRVDALEAFR